VYKRQVEASVVAFAAPAVAGMTAPAAQATSTIARRRMLFIGIHLRVDVRRRVRSVDRPA